MCFTTVRMRSSTINNVEPAHLQEESFPSPTIHVCTCHAADGNTLHASAPNLSSTSRWSLILGWALESNPVVVLPDPTHGFVPLEDAAVQAVVDAHEARLSSAGGGGGSRL